MRIALIADVHSNLAALEAVLADAEADGPLDALWCLGDVVGYGAEPAECIDLIRQYPNVTVAGNHDLAVVSAIGVEDFNPLASSAISWTRLHLDEPHQAWLRGLPQVVEEDVFTLVHGSLRDPVMDYLLSPSMAEVNFRRQNTPYCFVGHSHMPVAFKDTDAAIETLVLQHGMVLELDGSRFVANPGSVGQPRDGDKRSAYGLIDTAAARIEFRRVDYDVQRTQTKMRDAYLPPHLIERLSRGR